MRKERLSIEELQAMPKEAFPVTVECDDHEYTGHLKKITILSNVLARSHLATIDNDGSMYPFYCENLHHYPSLKPEVKKVKWYRVISQRRNEDRPYQHTLLFRDEQDFLSLLNSKKEHFSFIHFEEVGLEEVK